MRDGHAPVMTQVYLGLGSNVQRGVNVCTGLNALARLLQDIECSPVFLSEAVGPSSSLFFNMVVGGKTSLEPERLQENLKRIESSCGRDRDTPDQITLDIDILLYGNLCARFERFQIPRAEILENAFVLWPLSIIASDLLHPILQEPYSELWKRLDLQQRLWPVPFEWRGQNLTGRNLTRALSPNLSRNLPGTPLFLNPHMSLSL